jgi:hypothetical protein
MVYFVLYFKFILKTPNIFLQSRIHLNQTNSNQSVKSKTPSLSKSNL